MLFLAALHLAAHMAAPSSAPPEPAIVRIVRSVASSGLVCLAAQMRLPMDTNWLEPLHPVTVAGDHRLYVAFEGTPIVLMYEHQSGAYLGVAPPHLLWPMVVRRRLFAGLQGDWRAWGRHFQVFKTGRPGLTPIGYGGVLVRGNLLSYRAADEPPVPELSFLVAMERRGGVDFVASSYPCQDDRDAQAKHLNPLHFRRAVLPFGPVVLTACDQYGAVELSVWYRPAR